jgi:hypothetical protein
MLVNNTSGNILVLGDAIFSRSDVIAPLLEEGANSAKTYVVTPDLLGQDRSKLVDATHAITTSIDIPSGLSSASTVQGYNIADTTMRFTKGVLAMYHNVDNNFSSYADFGDYLRFLQFSDSGAYQGEHINGGSIGSVKLKSWPMPFVGNMHKVGSGVPSAVSGTRHYLARTLYTTDINPADYIAFGAGTLSISGTTATLSVTTTQDGVLPTPVSFTLDADFDSAYGIYHIHGNTGGSITDIIWPIGATKAIYTSTVSDTNTTIREIGEAYISF